jgi:hypothetical protein
MDTGLIAKGMRLSITEYHCGDAEIIVITGDIDMSTSPQVWEASLGQRLN